MADVAVDVLGLAEAELRDQRAANALGYGRAQALGDLHDLALSVAARQGVAQITLDQVIDGLTDEADIARLAYLLNDLMPDTGG